MPASFNNATNFGVWNWDRGPVTGGTLGNEHEGESCVERVERLLTGEVNQIQALYDKIAVLQRESLTLDLKEGGGEYQRSFRKKTITEEIARLNIQIQLKESELKEKRFNMIEACERKKEEGINQGRPYQSSGRTSPTEMNTALMDFSMEGR